VATRRKTLEEIEATMNGGEPRFTADAVSESKMMQALNWYGQNRDSKQAIKYISDYLKKNKIKVAADIVNRQNNTFGFLCRMKNNGAIFSDKHEEKFKSYVDDMLVAKSKPVVEKEEKKPTVSIQDRVAEKVSEMIGELEGSIDDYILSEFKKMPAAYGIMHGMNVKGMHAKQISEWAKSRRVQFEEALESKDPQIKEGWSNFTKVQLKKLVAYCDQVITDCIKISGEAVASRKPRKRKAKSPDQLVAKIQFLDEDDKYKLKSVSPTQIIGALQLWVFNVKTRKLGVYHALDSQGFGVKGTSLTNFSEMKSVQKTLRKPEATLPEVVKGAKIYLRNCIESVNSKASGLTGRLNSDTILLKIIK
jgi:hypothetical protein